MKKEIVIALAVTAMFVGCKQRTNEYNEPSGASRSEMRSSSTNLNSTNQISEPSGASPSATNSSSSQQGASSSSSDQSGSSSSQSGSQQSGSQKPNP
jgi:hypothetical protein